METNQQPNPNEVNQITDYHDEIQQIHKEGHELTIRSARNMLFLAGGLILVSYIIAMIASTDIINPIDIGIMIFFVGSFVALGLWTKKKPYTAIVTGIIVFILYVGFNVALRAYIEGPTGILKGLIGGWLFKIIILVALIRPLKDAKELQEMMNQKA